MSFEKEGLEIVSQGLRARKGVSLTLTELTNVQSKINVRKP